MNTTTLDGEAKDLSGQVKQTVGDATGDRQMQGSGIVDQIGGIFKKNAGSAKDLAAQGGPLVDKARSFAKQRPAATAALVGVVGLALFNTLRGK